MGNREPPVTTEVKCRKLLSKNKKIVLQWILGHCDISGNEKAGPLESKVTLITQTTDGKKKEENTLPKTTTRRIFKMESA